MKRRVALALASLGLGSQIHAGPQGGVVARGHANIAQNGAQTIVRAGNNAVINWQQFNIGAGETTTFVQPNAASVVWNRILDRNPSRIFGNLNANGFVVLFNQSGFYFGPDSVVKVGGLLVSAAPVTMPGDNGGANWSYNGPPPAASIINYGKMETKNGGSLFLVAEKIENHGTLMAPDGTLGLYAGKEVLVSESPDGRGLSARVRLPEGSIDNTGRLIADAGTIALHAQTVNNGGLIQANSVREHNGVIELVASESINLAAESQISAQGSAAGASAGGSITLKSEGSLTDATGSSIDVRGGAQGGDGGSVEISAKHVAAIHSRVDGTAHRGFTGGKLLIDPTDIVFGANTGENPDALYIDPSSEPPPIIGMQTVEYAADRDIFLAPFLAWNLSGIADPIELKLTAGRNITFGDSARINAGGNWSVSLAATTGGIYLNGGADVDGVRQNGAGSIQTLDGRVSLTVGTDLLIGSGFVRTMGGGSIDITVGGDVDAGTKNDGYQFNRFGPFLSVNGLGGIATGQGGDISIHAGNDIMTGPAAIGAYGAGSVTLAGRDITGRFLVHDGVGTVDAAYDFGGPGSPASLTLSKGAWNVTAGHDIYLNEVYNPNGSQNPNRVDGTKFHFDYDPEAAVSLAALHGVHLFGNDPIHAGNNNPGRLPIYAPRLDIMAGAGGIELGNDVVLAPSALGRLNIVTMNGGSLFSTPGNAYQIVMSDSDSTDYNDWVTGHAAMPLHRNHNGPDDAVTLAINGNIENVLLQVPKKAFIDVTGDTLNFAFEGQHLDPNDVTTLNVHGDIRSRGNRTSVEDVLNPNLDVLDPRFSVLPSLASKLIYDKVTHELSFVGRMSEAEREFLLNPQVRRHDANGTILLDVNGLPIIDNTHFIDAPQILALFNNSQDIPSSPNAFRGLQLGGPGRFNVLARNIDLGITAGIRSQGTLLNAALSSISPRGVDLNVHVAHDLEMGASQIASFAGGSITVKADNQINVGSQLNFTSDETPKGIFSSSGGDVTVEAEHNVNVNGSRIATYDGGDIHVVSHHGDIDAGAGGLGSVSVFRTVVDPESGQVTIVSTTIPGSGILATTLPGTDSRIGNIKIEAQDGSVIASSGGVLQLSFNRIKENDSATIDISAYGHKDSPSKGNIQANNSGIIGGNVRLDADGDITGLVVARQDINIRSDANVSVTALAIGTATVGGANVSGSTIVGGEGAKVSAATISDSTIVANNASVSGAQSGVQAGVGSTAAATVAAKVSEDADKTVVKKSDEDDDPLKKNRKPIQLAHTVGRVTVILPEKNK